MENLTNIYFYTALVSTILYVVKMFIFAVFGGDAEVHTDFNASFESEDSFDFISIQSILAFLMGFGWMGLACIKVWHLNTILTIAISVAFGLLLLFASAWLMFQVKKLNKKVVKDLSKAVGLIGKAYTNFEPNGQGQIEITINEQLSVEEAVNTKEEPIKAFEMVKVVKYENNKLYIEKE